MDTGDIKRDMEIQDLSYQDVANRVINMTDEYISRETIYKLLDPTDPYNNPDTINLIKSAISKRYQWQLLLDWYLSGRRMTARNFVTKIGPTQIHPRHIEICKNAGYVMREEGAVYIFDVKVIMSRWVGTGRGKYKEYWIP